MTDDPLDLETLRRGAQLAGFVWTELSGRARRVLGDVATLARAFGWTEGQVMALPEKRRAAYLALVRDGVA